MAQHFDLADFGKTFHAPAAVEFSQRFRRIRRRNVQWRKIKRALPWRRLLKDQAFALGRVPQNLS